MKWIQTRFSGYLFCFFKTMVLFMCLFCFESLTIAYGEVVVKTSDSMQYAVGRRCVWTVEAGVATCTWFEDGSSKKVAQLSNVTHIAADQDDLIYLTETEERQAIGCLDSKGNVLVEVELPMKFYVRQIEAFEGVVYALGGWGENILEEQQQAAHEDIHENHSIYRIDMYVPDTIQKLEIDGWNNEQITAMSVFEGNLFSYSDYFCQASVVDLYEKVLRYEPVSLVGAEYIAAADQVEDELHMYSLSYAEQDNLWLINMKTGKKHNLVEGVPEYCVGLRRSQDRLFTLDSQGKMLLSFPTLHIQDNAPNTITIINALREGTPRMKRAIEMFKNLYPDYEIAFRYVPDARVLATAVMSGTEGYDIICVQEANAAVCSPILFKSGAIVDLSESAEIQANMSEYLNMFDPVTENGHVYGIPELVSLYIWEVNTELADKLGVVLPDKGWTWEDFFELSDAVSTYNRDNSTSYYLLEDNVKYLPYFFIQYNANAVDIANGCADYMNSVFVRLLKEWVAVCEEGLICTDEERFINDEALFRVVEADYSFLGARQMILPPVFDDKTKYPINMISMEVSSNASDKEACISFLACYMSAEALLTEPINSYGKWLKDASRYIPMRGEAVSADNEELWCLMLENSVQDCFIGDLYRDQYKTLYPQLLAGTISAEKYVETCQMRANMVLGE